MDNKESKFNFVSLNNDNENSDLDNNSLEEVKLEEKDTDNSLIDAVSNESVVNDNENGNLDNNSLEEVKLEEKEINNTLVDDVSNESVVNDNNNSNLDNDSLEDVKVEEKEINNTLVDDVSSNSLDNEKNESNNSGVVDNNIKKKLYISFEARVINYVLLILLFFVVACYFILEAVNFGKKEVVNYNEISSLDYSVCKNSGECLGGKNNSFNTTDVKNIKANFKYNVDYTQNIEYDLAYHVVASIKIVDPKDPDKALYSDQEVLIDRTDIKDNSNLISIDRDIDIDYYNYNLVATNFKTRYANNANATLDVVLYLDEQDETRNVASLTIPLATDSFIIKDTVLNNTNESIDVSIDTWNKYNSTCAIIATVLIVISMILLYRLACLVLKVTTNRNRYQVVLNDLLSEYDRLIVIARDGYESEVEREVVKIYSFEELLKIRENLNKPIVYSKVNDVKSEFIVEDDDKIYRYILKEADYTDK